jgi:glycosyltransferase involved in cell wall biosynthesis
MDGRLRGPGQAPGDFTDEAIAALRALEATGPDPILLGYHPVARLNPYHSLLYQQSWKSGIGTVPILRDETFPELTELARLGFSTLLHLHWLNLVLVNARSAKEAGKDRRAFLDRLDRMRDAGGRIAWTVHNILPHAARFEDEEARLSADIVERSAVVHTMATRTPEIVAPWFTIPPEKILQVPHPSYLRAYEDRIGRDQARHELGLWPGEIVHVVLGAIRPYKGLYELLDAWDAISADGTARRLVIAGGPTDEPGVAELLERAAIHPSVLVHAGPVAPADVQLYLRAADVAVLPYVRALNSGALMLAVTFGLPVVVPSGGGLAEVIDERFARTFAIDDPAQLVTALREVEALDPQVARAAALEVAERHDPAVLSARFAEGLRARLSPATPLSPASPLDEDSAIGPAARRSPARATTRGARPAG